MAEFSHVVYQSTDGSSLFSYKSIISMCSIETVQLKSVSGYTDLCETKGPADCCPGWTLGGYIALLYNRTSCFTITVSRHFTEIFVTMFFINQSQVFFINLAPTIIEIN